MLQFLFRDCWYIVIQIRNLYYFKILFRLFILFIPSQKSFGCANKLCLMIVGTTIVLYSLDGAGSACEPICESISQLLFFLYFFSHFIYSSFLEQNF